MRMMTRVGIVLTLAVGLIAADAMAWGPRAKRSISGMALQVIKKDFPNVFRPSGVTGPNFEEDLLRGANDGYAILGAEIPLNNDAEVVQAIANQIQLLRDVRKAGPSSYFAYRMGVLAALTADVTLPFGFAWSADDQAIQAKVNEDTEMRLDGFGYAPHQEHRIFLRDPREYFAKARMFYAEDKKIILEDYTRGQGYDGFLAQGGKAYFGRAVEAVSDVWYSVLRPEEEPGQVPATQRTLAWYYVDEIKYLLQAKHNLTQAEKSYEHFVDAGQGLPAAYDAIGDLYYAFGTPDTALRGVREWKNAFDMPGAERDAIAKKLASHYMKEGQAFLESSSKPGAKDTDLPNALNAFEQAFEYNRTSKEISDLIEKTHVAITERNERFVLTTNIIATGEKIQAEAEKARLGGDRGLAIKTFRQAIVILDGVGNEFKEQEKTAKEGIRKLKKSINDTINEILDQASDAISEGEKAKDAHDYAAAIASYQKVPTIVSVIPEDENPQLTEQKQEVTSLAEKKIEEAKADKIRYDNAQKEAAEAAKRGGKAGARPAAGAPAAAPAAPAAPPAQR